MQIKYPKRVAISNILFTPQSLPTAIIRGYLLGSNDGTTWEAVYSEFTVTTWTTTAERSLLPTGYTPNTKQFLFYRLVARQIQGVTTGALGATEKLAIATLRFTYNQNVAFIDSVLCIGDPVGGTIPAANCILDVNGATNMQGSVNILGNVGVGVTDTVTYKLNVGGTAYLSGLLTANSGITTNNISSYGTNGPLVIDPNYSSNNYIQMYDDVRVQGVFTATGNCNVGSLNNITVTDFLRASQNVIFSKADYCRFEYATAYASYSYSQFTINANLLRSEYSRPQVQWRWFMGISTGDVGRFFSWGFWCVYYDQYYNSFSATRLAGTGDISISQNWDGNGWNRCIITIVNGNPAYLLNINFL